MELFALSIAGDFSSLSKFCKHLLIFIWALTQRGWATLPWELASGRAIAINLAFIVTIINCLLLLHLDTECGSCAKHNEAQFPTPWLRFFLWNSFFCVPLLPIYAILKEEFTLYEMDLSMYDSIPWREIIFLEYKCQFSWTWAFY